MTDYFEALHQPRQPWLDVERVREAFLSASAEHHPDRLHEAPEDQRREAHERATILNQAHFCLKNSRTRLRHFLELERGTPIRDLHEIPEDLMQIFMKLGDLLKLADQQVAEAARTDSPMLKVAHFKQTEELRDSLEEAQAMLKQRRDELESRLRSSSHIWKQLNPADADRREKVLTDLESLYRLMTFHDRWIEQVQARALRLLDGV